MTITVRQLLKFLPIDPDVRKNVSAAFEEMTPDQQLEIRQVCWTMYFELFYLTVQSEFQRALEDIGEDKRRVSNDLYQQVEKQVSDRFARDLREEQETDALEDVRIKLRMMVKEKLKGKFSQKTTSPYPSPPMPSS